MNVYDFDGTVYAGDSTVDFYFFCLRKTTRNITCGRETDKRIFFI